MIPLFRTIFGVLFGWVIGRLAALNARLHGTPASTKIARRGFIRNAALGATSVLSLFITGGFVRLLWPNKTGAFGKALTVPASAIPPVDGEPFRNTEGKFYLVHTTDGLMALYWKCPHLGCTVPWDGGSGEFHCPCHGSIYSYNGERLGGPAPRPMDYMAVTVQPTGDVVVDTGDIRERSEYEPSQAVPL